MDRSSARAAAPRRGQRGWRALGLLAAAMLPVAASAGGSGDDVKVTVTPLQASVTYSRAATATRPGMTTYVGYTVTVRNVDDDKLNNVRFVATTSVTEATEKAVFASADGATCATTNADGTAIECTLGTLARYASYPTFTVFFTAPARSTTLPAGDVASCTTTDCIGLAGQVLYTEGWDRYPRVESTAWSAAPVALGTGDPNKVQSAVPSGGATLYTGDGGFSTPSDLYTTSIVVPAGYVPPAGSLPTAQIVEAAETLTCTTLTNCFRSDITVPGTISPYLTVVLRVDATNIRKGTKIGSVLISYDGLIIGDCASPTTPRTDFIPCIAKRVAYPKPRKYRDDDDKYGSSSTSSTSSGTSSTTTVPPDLEGDFEWTIINLRNGSYRIL